MDKDDIWEIRNRVVESMPDYMKGQSEEVQEAYISYEVTKMQWELDPNRYFKFANRKGEEVELDLNVVNVRHEARKKGATEAQALEALERRKKFAVPVLRRLRNYKERMKHIFGSRYTVAIVENAEEIIDLFAQYYTVTDVVKILKDKKGYNVSSTTLKVFYADNKETIEKRRFQFLSNRKDFFVATDAGRLQVLNDLLLNYRLKFEREDKIVYSKEIRAILEQARKECKGEQLFLTVDGKIDINAMVHGQDNVSGSLQRLPINMIVIGLVAAMNGLNPATIIGQLASSYYRDHNGFNQVFLDGQNIQLPGDIIRNMTWEELKKKNEQWHETISPIEDAVVVPPEEEPIVEDKRKKLLELLNRKKDEPKETVEDNGLITTKLVKPNRCKDNLKKDIPFLAEDEEEYEKKKVQAEKRKERRGKSKKELEKEEERRRKRREYMKARNQRLKEQKKNDQKEEGEE